MLVLYSFDSKVNLVRNLIKRKKNATDEDFTREIVSRT